MYLTTAGESGLHIPHNIVALQWKEESGKWFLLFCSWNPAEHYLVSKSLISHTSTGPERGRNGWMSGWCYWDGNCRQEPFMAVRDGDLVKVDGKPDLNPTLPGANLLLVPQFRKNTFKFQFHRAIFFLLPEPIVLWFESVAANHPEPYDGNVQLSILWSRIFILLLKTTSSIYSRREVGWRASRPLNGCAE